MANKNKRFLTLDTSSSENDEDDDEYYYEDVRNPRVAVISSDSSEEDETEKECHVKVEDCNCPICLNDFTNQRIGVPSDCNHLFCVDCILEWSKNANSCPVDRTEFSRIRVYQRNGGPFVNDIVIEGKPCEKAELLEINCEICNQGNNEDMLLLCDGCDRGYHCQCLNPPLLEVPSDEWFCDECLDSMTPSRPTRQRHARMVGRTMASERVRSQITRSRLRRARIVSNLDEQLDAIFNDIIANAHNRMRVLSSESQRLSRATRKRRKTTKRSKSKPSKSKRSKSTRKKKKRSTSRKAPKKCTTTINKKENGNNRKKSEAVETSSTSLSLFGGVDDLDEYLAADEVQEHDPSHLIARKHRVLSRSAIRFNVPLPSLFATGSVRSERSTPIPEPTPTPFLLDNILSGQEVLLAPSQNLSIKHGKLSLNKKPKPSCCVKRDEKKKDIAVPNTNQTALSPKGGKSEASSSNKTSYRRPRNSTENDKSSSSLPRRFNSTSNENANSSVNGQGDDNAGNSSENFHKSDKTANKESKKPLKGKNSTPVVKPRKILIRPVFNLPKNESSKNESNVYDPFEAITDDLSPEKEEGLYDPFQPIISDEEEAATSAGSPEKSTDRVENFGKFSFKREGHNLSEKSGNSRGATADEAFDNSVGDVDDLLDESLNLSGNLKTEKSIADEQSSPASKSARIRKEEFDMFAEEAQKSEPQPTADIQNPPEEEAILDDVPNVKEDDATAPDIQEPNEEDTVSENTREEVEKEETNSVSEGQVKLPEFLPTPAQEDTAVKFKRVFEKPKDGSNENEDKDVEDGMSDDEYQPPLKPVQIKTSSKKSSKEEEGSSGRRRRNRSRSVENKGDRSSRRETSRDRRSRSRSRKRSSRNDRGSRNRRRSLSRSRRTSGGRSRRRSRSRSQRRSRKSKSRSRSRRRSTKSRRRSRSRSRKRSPRKSPSRSRRRSEDRKTEEAAKTPSKEVDNEEKVEKKRNRKKSRSDELVNSLKKPDSGTEMETEPFTDNKAVSHVDVSKENEDTTIISAKLLEENDDLVEETNDTLDVQKEILSDNVVKEKSGKSKKSKKHKVDKERGTQQEEEKVIFTPKNQKESEFSCVENIESAKTKKSKREKHQKKNVGENLFSDDSKLPESSEDRSPVSKKLRKDSQEMIELAENTVYHQSDSFFEKSNIQELASAEEMIENVKSHKKTKKSKQQKVIKEESLDESMFTKSPKKKRKKHKKEQESDHFFENKFSDGENFANKVAVDNTGAYKDNAGGSDKKSEKEKKAKKKKKQHQLSDSVNQTELNQTLEIETPVKSSKKAKHKKHKNHDSEKPISGKKNDHSAKEKVKHLKKESVGSDFTSDEPKPEISVEAYADMLLDDLTAVKEIPKPSKRSLEVDEWSKDLTLDPSDIKKHSKPLSEREIDIDDLLEASFKKSADTVSSSAEKNKPESSEKNKPKSSEKIKPKGSEKIKPESFEKIEPESAEKIKLESFEKSQIFHENSTGKLSRSPSPYSPTRIEFESPNNSGSEEKPSMDYVEANWSPEMLPIPQSPTKSQPSDNDVADDKVIKIVEDHRISCIDDIFADSPKIETEALPTAVSPIKENAHSPLRMFSMSMGKAPVIAKNTLFSDSSPTRKLPLLNSGDENIFQEKTSLDENRENKVEVTKPEMTLFSPEEKESSQFRKVSPIRKVNEAPEVPQEDSDAKNVEKSSEEKSDREAVEDRAAEDVAEKSRNSRSEKKRSRHYSSSSSPSKRRSHREQSPRKRRSRSRKRARDSRRSSSRSKKSSRYREDSSKRRKRSRTPDQKSSRRRSRSPRRKRRSRTPERRRRESRRERHRSPRSPKPESKFNPNVGDAHSSSGGGRMSPQPIATISSISTIGHSFNRNRHSSISELMPDTQFEQLQTHVNNSSALIQIPTLDHATVKQVSGVKSSNINLSGNPESALVGSSGMVETGQRLTAELNDHKDGTTLPNADTSESAEKSPLPPPPPPKKTDPRMESTSATAQNILTLKALTGLSSLAKEKEESVLNPTQILNIVGLNPTQQSAAKNAIMNIAELSKKLQLGQFLAGGSLENPSVSKIKSKEDDELSPLSINDVEGSAVEMYNKDKVKQLQKKKSFQEQVVEEAKNAIKPHYERREINKTQYKDIMKRAVNKICQTDRTMEVNGVKIRRLIRRYVECYQEKNEKHKEKMRSTLDKKVDKQNRSKKLVAPPMSPPSPLGSPLTGGEYDDNGGGLILKKEPRKIVTLPDLPLPPPPPPPKPRYMMK